MTTLILKLMKSKFAAAGAVLIVALIIILMGPRFYLVVPYNYIVAVVVLLGWVGWMLYQKMKAKKNAAALEGFLSQQADDQMLTARPDVKDEIAALKEKMEFAVKTLKKSKMGRGHRGASALYVLPWYMIIGPSACGKSTAIRNSGLNFPPVDPDSDTPGAIKGLGGTRNCDWWFTNEGIILDTAGRYTISVDAAEDREEWTAFLGLLKKYRKKNPINGLLLMVSVDELVQQSEDGIEAHAKNIRQRVDELMVKLEIIFPVYLVFTKCDLLSGFVEYFGDLSKREREQVWGYTCKYDIDRTSPVHEEFKRESDKLFAALKARSLRKLHGDLRPGDEKKVYLFPLEFDAARRKLTAFVETLFQPNPYQQNPALRGVYFTSGTQEGTPIGQVMGAMAKEFALDEEMAELIEPPKEPKAYFIKDLFTHIIMLDQAATRPTASSAKRGRFMRLAMAGGIAVATILLAFAMGTSYVRNTSLLSEARDAVSDSMDTRSREIAALEAHIPLLNVLEELDRHQNEGAPLSYRWGLYKGGRVNKDLRSYYMGVIRDEMLRPTLTRMEGMIERMVNAETATPCSVFLPIGTAHMMLTMPPDSAPNRPEVLVDRAQFVWNPQRDAEDERRPELDRLLKRNVLYFWRHHEDKDVGNMVLRSSPRISRLAESKVLECFDISELYRQIIAEANDNLREFRVPPGLLEGQSVMGAYTRNGWENEVEPGIKRSQEKIEQDPFFQKAFANRELNIQDELFALYVDNYGRVWQRFFEDLRVAPFYNIAEAMDGLRDLASDKSPMIELLKEVVKNSTIKRDGETVAEIADEFAEIREFLGQSDLAGAVTGESSESTDKYREYLGTAIDRLETGQGELDESVECGKALKRLSRNLLERLRKSATSLMIGGRSALSRKAREFLGQPFNAAYAAAAADAGECLNRAWDEQVYIPFQDLLARKYPFNKHGDDASFDEIVQFFGGSAGGIGKFVSGEGRGADDARISLSGEYSNAVRAAEKIREIISGGGLSLSFTLTARSPQFKNMQSATFRLGGRSFEYLMGGERTREFSWPADGTDCSISSIPLQGGQASPLNESGDWGLFRMLDRATRDGGTFVWEFQVSGNRATYAGYEIGGRAARFLKSGRFSSFQCPPKVCAR